MVIFWGAASHSYPLKMYISNFQFFLCINFHRIHSYGKKKIIHGVDCREKESYGQVIETNNIHFTFFVLR